MSENTKNSRGKWAAIAGIATAVVTSLTTLALAIITSGNIDHRLEKGRQANDKKVETSVSAAAVDVLWLKERVQQLEVAVAIQKALRTNAEDRLNRVEARLLRRGGHRSPTAASRPIDLDAVTAKAKEEVIKERPPRPSPDDERVQQLLKIYFEKK